MGINAQYSVAAPDSLPVKIAAFQREKIFAAFLQMLEIDEQHSILDVGATSDRTYEHSWYPHKARITAVGLDDARFLETAHPGTRFVRADGRNLPFADETFDFVHSSAVMSMWATR
jgi:ubiquinone/menaquinone biosynthesis C-methylase UbiE